MRYVGTIALALLLPALMLAQGCANTYARNHMSAERDLRERLVVAVMPFQGVSESPGSGLIVADVMANELYALGGYTLITPEVVAARAAPREGEVLSPEETGKMVGAQYILTGRVTEYTYKSGVGEQPAVGITARLIECATGRVLWSATRARTGSAAWFQEDSLGLLTSRICRDMAQSVKGIADEYGMGSVDDDFYAYNHPVVKDKPKASPEEKAKEDASAKPDAESPRDAAPNVPEPERPSGADGTAEAAPVALYDYYVPAASPIMFTSGSGYGSGIVY